MQLRSSWTNLPLNFCEWVVELETQASLTLEPGKWRGTGGAVGRSKFYRALCTSAKGLGFISKEMRSHSRILSRKVMWHRFPFSKVTFGEELRLNLGAGARLEVDGSVTFAVIQVRFMRPWRKKWEWTDLVAVWMWGRGWLRTGRRIWRIIYFLKNNYSFGNSVNKHFWVSALCCGPF